MTEPIRWGICGAGSIAGQFAASLVNVPDAEIVAVASTDAGRGAEFADSHGIPTVHRGYERLAEDADVDVVYVASTQQRHVDDVLLMLDGGRNVLCEKPFALNGAQARTMIERAASSGLFLMEALWSRFLPSYVRLRELLDEGVIGEPQVVEANFSFRISDEKRAGHRLFDPHRGGGALLDLGIYPVHLAHFVFGPPRTVHAAAVMAPEGVDERTTLMLDHPGGGASLLHTGIRVEDSCAARIVGTEGTIGLDPFMHCTTRLRVDRGGSEESEVLDFPPPSLHYQVPEVHRCLREGRLESDVMPHDDTLAMMATLDEARRQIGLEFPDE